MRAAATLANADDSLPVANARDADSIDRIHLRLDRINAALADLSGRIADLVEAGVREADLTSSGNPKSASFTPLLTLGQWLAEASNQAQGGKSILAIASWKAACLTCGPSRNFDVDFEVDLLSVDGRPAEAPAVEVVRIPTVPASSSFAHHSTMWPVKILLACQSIGKAWNVSAYSIGTDGGLGKEIAMAKFSSD
jgi:hypothetical protein